MKLNYKQKRFIHDNINKLSDKEISYKLALPIDLISKHIEDQPHLSRIRNEVNSIEPDKSFLSWFNRHIPFLIILFALVIIGYANAFNADLVSDDIPAIVDNPVSAQSPKYLTINPLFVLRLVQYYIAFHLGGHNPFFYRIFNIFFHLGTIYMVYLIIPQFTKKKYLPFLVAALFAVHPMMIESVTWISGGIYAQSAFSVLISFYLYLRYRKCGKLKFLIFSLIAFVCALSTSEKVIIFPFIIGLYELVYGKLSQTWYAIISFFGVSFFWGLMMLGRVQSRVSYLKTVNGPNSFDVLYNPFIQIPVALATYIKLYVWPRHLTLYHSEFHLSFFQYFVNVFIAIGFVAVVIIAYKKKNKLIVFWLLFFIISLLTTMNPFGLSWIVAERYAYLGSIGIFVFIGYLFHKLLDKPKYETLGFVLFGLLIILLTARTIVRNIDWYNQDNLWIATGKASPSDPKTHNNLGDYHFRHNDFQNAFKEFSRAVELNPNYSDGYHNLGNTLIQLGQQDKAIESYKKATELNPGLWQSFQNISALYYNKADYKNALIYMQKAKSVNPTNINIDANIAVLYMRLNEYQKASELVNKILEVDPQNKSALEVSKELKSAKK